MEEFNIVEKLLGMTLLGTEWVLWLLIFASVLSVAVMLERIVYYTGLRINMSDFTTQLNKHLIARDYKAAEQMCINSSSLEGRVAKIGLENQALGKSAMQGSMEGFVSGERYKLDKGLVILGTLGNNAPFIGLFGTVLGIIMAFNDLALNPDGGPSVVMAGISEALVATAVGLIVAIPAVIAFNLFNRIVKQHLANAESIIKLLLTSQETNLASEKEA